MLFVTTIIPTIGRAELGRAVCSVLEQRLDADFEIIVVNDSGAAIDPQDWQAAEHVQVVDTWQHERSVARNTGAALARGQYLHFLDDDDWLLPGGLAALRQTALDHPAAGWVCGGAQLVDRHLQHLVDRHYTLPPNCFIQVVAGEWLPLQSSLIRAEDFFMAGGFNPLMVGPEVSDLVRRMMLKTNLACCPQLTACIVIGSSNSTTNIPLSRIGNRMWLDTLLNEKTAFAHMCASAFNSYWRGQVARAYLTSLVWNAVERRPFTMLSRLLYSGLSIGRFLRDWTVRDFWRAVAKPYQIEIFARGFEKR